MINTEMPMQPSAAPARSSAGGGTGQGSPASEAPPTLPAIPRGGARLIVNQEGDRTVFTSSALPPDYMRLAHGAQETAFGLLGLFAAIVILGPFARMWARRMETRAETTAATGNSQLLQQQLVQLQQSVDAMSVEVERISESQRFQSKLLFEKQEPAVGELAKAARSRVI